MRYRVRHRTEYEYSEPVQLCHNEARLRPRSTPYQSCIASELEIAPQPSARAERDDLFGNRVLYFAIQGIHQHLVVTATSEVDCHRPQRPASSDLAWEAAAETVLRSADAEIREAQQFILDSPSVERSNDLLEYARPSFPAGRPLLESVFDLSARIHREFEFDPSRTTVTTHLSEVLDHRGGVCQDFAHLAIGCLRSLRLPARYVSGYLETVPAAGQPRLEGADASHAWFSVFVPECGWVDLDPTNDQMPDDRYVTIGWGRDYSDVTPFKGVLFGGGAHTMHVGVDMRRIDADS